MSSFTLMYTVYEASKRPGIEHGHSQEGRKEGWWMRVEGEWVTTQKILNFLSVVFCYKIREKYNPRLLEIYKGKRESKEVSKNRNVVLNKELPVYSGDWSPSVGPIRCESLFGLQWPFQITFTTWAFVDLPSPSLQSECLDSKFPVILLILCFSTLSPLVNK